MKTVIAGLATALVIVLGIKAFLLRRLRRTQWKYLSFRPLKWKTPLESGDPILLDQQVEFDSRLANYTKIAEVITTLSAASIAFVPQLHTPTQSSLFAYCLVLLGATVLLCILFMVLLTFFYEASLYAPAAYTPERAAWVQAVGFGGLLCFALAYLVLASEIGWAF